MMKISKEEQEAIKQVIAIGAAYGYGNMMGHLSTAWVRDLLQHGFAPGVPVIDEDHARRIVHGQPYPVLMQDDLIERGEWDETGERYRKAKP